MKEVHVQVCVRSANVVHESARLLVTIVEIYKRWREYGDDGTSDVAVDTVGTEIRSTGERETVYRRWGEKKVVMRLKQGKAGDIDGVW